MREAMKKQEMEFNSSLKEAKKELEKKLADDRNDMLITDIVSQ